MKYFIFPKIEEEHIGRFSYGAQPLTLLMLHNVFESHGDTELSFIDENIGQGIQDFSTLDNDDYIFISINLFNHTRALDIISTVLNDSNAQIVIGGPLLELAEGDSNKIGIIRNTRINIVHGGWGKIIEFLKFNFNIYINKCNWDSLHQYQKNRLSKSVIETYTAKHKEYSGFNYSGNYTNIHSSLGCYYRLKTGGCNFCSRHFENYESFQPKTLVNTLKSIWEQYQVTYFWDSSDAFFNSNKDLETLLEQGISDIPIELLIFSRLNNINKNTAKLLRECNVKTMIVGIESGSDRILKVANKHLTVKQIYKSLNVLNNNEISVIPCLTIGHPSENFDDLDATIELAKNISQNFKVSGFSCSPIIPIPGSRYYSDYFNNLQKINLETILKIQKSYFSKVVDFNIDVAKDICLTIESLNNLKPLGIWGNKQDHNTNIYSHETIS